MKAHLLFPRQLKIFVVVLTAISFQFLNPVQVIAQTPGLIYERATGGGGLFLIRTEMDTPPLPHSGLAAMTKLTAKFHMCLWFFQWLSLPPI